ncbi:MAG: hypothetical protein IT384_11665 [Deltaproteobacteria bacterium]|nr:hypothetical protein [Deltaproteobacteria bacterium]
MRTVGQARAQRAKTGQPRGWLVIAAQLALLPAGARAEDRPRLGIVPHPVVNVEPAERDALTRDIGRSIAQHYAVDVIYGDQYSGKLPDDCVAQQECPQNVGRELRADQLLFLVIVRVGARTQIDPMWVDVSSGRSSARDPIIIEEGGRSRDQVLREATPVLIPRGSAQTIAQTTPTKPPPRGNGGGGAGAGTGGGSSGGGTGGPAPVDPWRDSGPEESPEGGGVNVGGWVATGVGTAALIVGLALVLGGIGEYNGLLERGCDVPQGRCQEELDRYGTRSLIANMLLAGAGVAGVTAVVLFSADQEMEATGSIGLAPTRDGVGLGFGGRF